MCISSPTHSRHLAQVTWEGLGAHDPEIKRLVSTVAFQNPTPGRTLITGFLTGGGGFSPSFGFGGGGERARGTVALGGSPHLW